MASLKSDEGMAIAISSGGNVGYDDKATLISHEEEDENREDIMGISHDLNFIEEEISVATPRNPVCINLESKFQMDGDEHHLIILQCSQTTFYHFCVLSVLIVAATVSFIAFPQYLQTINDCSDAYCALLITSLFYWVFSIIVLIILKARSTSNSSHAFIPPIPLKKILKLGVYFAVSGLAIVYSRDRNRVLCHLQDPLTAAILPIAVVCHFCFGSKVDKSRKLFCIAVVIIGLFICIDFQIWDEFRCHGQNMVTGNDGNSWTPDEHAIWTIVYLSGLGLLALYYAMLEHELRRKQYPEMLVATIPLSPCSPSVVNCVDTPGSIDLPLNDAMSSTSSNGRLSKTVIPYIPHPHAVPVLDLIQILTLNAWLQTASLITTILLFWTDLFSFLGKAGSIVQFNLLMQNGIACHFNAGTDCAALPTAAWPFIIFSSIFIMAAVYLIASTPTYSSAYLIATLTTVLPLSAFCWSFFQADGSSLHWQPSFTGETGFTIIGLPIMAVALGFYHYYANKEKMYH